jgi:hypothetical protein
MGEASGMIEGVGRGVAAMGKCTIELGDIDSLLSLLLHQFDPHLQSLHPSLQLRNDLFGRVDRVQARDGRIMEVSLQGGE